MDEELEKLFGQIKSDQIKINPENKILLDEANELLKHCNEETDIGPIFNSTKLDLKKFLFLKNVKGKQKVNKYIITTLAWASNQNILLRYLLVESGLRNKKVERILKETNFYEISNHPEDFYFENNVPEELRFSETALRIKLKHYAILTPEESSYLVVYDKAKIIIEQKIKNFIFNLKSKMDNTLHILISQNKYNNKVTRRSREILKDEKSKDLMKYYKVISKSYFYWSKSLVEAEFAKKQHSDSGGFIQYLNRMYWLNTEQIHKFFDSFFFFPNLLIDIYDKHSIDTEFLFTKIMEYSKKIETESKASKSRAKQMSGKKITQEDMAMYKEILSIRKDNTYSYSEATKIYSENKKLFWKPNKIKSVAETIRKNYQNGLII